MLYSMTGFGHVEGNIGNTLQLSVDLRSVNGKHFDLNTHRLPPFIKPFIIPIRSLLKDTLYRGSVNISFQITQQGNEKPMVVNKALMQYYNKTMNDMAEALSLKTTDEGRLATLMNLPEVIAPDLEVLRENDWPELKQIINSAAQKLKEYRQKEGAAIETDLLKRVDNIEQLLVQIAPLEKERMTRIKNQLLDSFSHINETNDYDKNRFEQELVYYLNKIDFSEEKQRLTAHCQYFKELCHQGEEQGMGKKLGFVLQEIGREINTLGSKANDAAIQKIVVNMKDELEKAKEQILNVL